MICWGEFTKLRLAAALAASLLCAPFAAGQQVRIGYLLPDGRTEQSGAVANLQSLILEIQDWYADEMARYGFGRKTFAVEFGPDGATPTVHVTPTPVSDAVIRSDSWGESLDAAEEAGLSIWTKGDVWLLVPESHVQSPDGSIAGGTALGGSFGSGLDGGVALVGSDYLTRFNPDWLFDESPYAGQVIEEIGPYPLVQDVSFPWYHLDTISSSSSASQGAVAHELGHAFGLPHDHRNDQNYHGVVMGNGFRGWRGSRHPDEFPRDEAALSYAAALALNSSRYFNAGDALVASTKPTLSIQASGDVATTDGRIEIPFTAFDSDGLSAAFLLRNGEVVEEQPLTGESVQATFRTPYFDVDVSEEFEIRLYDVHGNRTEAKTNLTVAAGSNRAPQPFVTLRSRTIDTGEPNRLMSHQSTDPDDPIGSLLVEWDLDGDGAYDTEPTTIKTEQVVFETPGDWLLRARLTDPHGAWSESTFLSLRVFNALPGDADLNHFVDLADFNLLKSSFGQTGDHLAADFNLDYVVDLADFGALKAHFNQSAPVPEPATWVLAAVASMASALGMRRTRQWN